MPTPVYEVARHPHEDLRPGWEVAGYAGPAEATAAGWNYHMLCNHLLSETPEDRITCWRAGGHTGPHARRTITWNNDVVWPNCDDMDAYRTCAAETQDRGWCCTLPHGHDGMHVATFGTGELCQPAWINNRVVPRQGREGEFLAAMQFPHPERHRWTGSTLPRPARVVMEAQRRASFRPLDITPRPAVATYDEPEETEPPRSEINSEFVQ